MKSSLQEGDRVMVFGDPVKEKYFNGEAVLFSFLGEAAYPGYEYWYVHFEKENKLRIKMVHPDHQIL